MWIKWNIAVPIERSFQKSFYAKEKEEENNNLTTKRHAENERQNHAMNNTGTNEVKLFSKESPKEYGSVVLDNTIRNLTFFWCFISNSKFFSQFLYFF